jgi:hypothetical protein
MKFIMVWFVGRKPGAYFEALGMWESSTPVLLLAA